MGVSVVEMDAAVGQVIGAGTGKSVDAEGAIEVGMFGFLASRRSQVLSFFWVTSFEEPVCACVKPFGLFTGREFFGC